MAPRRTSNSGGMRAKAHTMTCKRLTREQSRNRTQQRLLDYS